MRAAWYEQQGTAADVLRVGELPEPEPGPGEVRVRVRYSGINPGDVKKRHGVEGALMPYPRVVPHGDGAGVIDRVGEGVDPGRAGRRVWIYGAQSYRPSGTAAEYTVVPHTLAVDLPDTVDEQTGACLGIPGITAHRALFADGPLTGATVLVHGALGAVGSIAAQLAHRAGAHVITTVRRTEDLSQLRGPAMAHAVALDSPDAVNAIRAYADGGVDRIIEVSLSDNADLDAAVAGNDAVVAAYASRAERPHIPFWPLLFSNVSIRLFGSDDFPAAAKQQAATDLTAAAAAGELTIAVAPPLPLSEIALAHDRVERGSRARTVLAINADG
jgi:NADPH2:quinone reductase